VVTRIESNLVKAEENHWRDLDAAQRGLKDRLLAILAQTPTLNEQQRASAVYLLSLGRPPTNEEMKEAQKQLVETNGRAASTLSLARSLVRGKEFCAEVAGVNVRLTKARADLIADKEVANQLQRLNSEEFQKMSLEVGNTLSKVMKNDESLVDLVFLLALSRFPRAQDAEMALAHLKKAGRQTGSENLIWVLLNTKEFQRAE
jgi:hypothetical protein